jgi:beta-phosphoglucomutase
MLKAVIFDFDGVIADSENLHFKAFEEIFRRYGFTLDRQTYWRELLGFTDLELFQEAAAKYGINYGISYQNLIDEKSQVFMDVVKTTSTVFPTIRDFVCALRESGIRCAICSGAYMVDIDIIFEMDNEITGHDLGELFEIVVAADHVSRGKPDPEGYLLAGSRLRESDESLKNSDCLVIEDSSWGLMAAKAAGMKTLAVTNSYPKEILEQHADLVVDTLKPELIPQMKKIFD